MKDENYKIRCMAWNINGYKGTQMKNENGKLKKIKSEINQIRHRRIDRSTYRKRSRREKKYREDYGRPL